MMPRSAVYSGCYYVLEVVWCWWHPVAAYREIGLVFVDPPTRSAAAAEACRRYGSAATLAIVAVEDFEGDGRGLCEA